MLTTRQVRDIIRKNSKYKFVEMWTNKTTGDTSNRRRVKCYYDGDTALVAKLQQSAGIENVRVTTDGGITVQCVLA